MEINNKILVGMGISLIAIAVLLIGISSAVSDSATISFNVTVESGVTITPMNTSFGVLHPDETITLTPSFTASNTKATNATLEASFTTNIAGNYGLVSADTNNIILAEYFSFSNQGEMEYMNNSGVPITIGTVETEESFDATLTVPPNQEAKSYAGIIDILISFD